MRDLRSELTTIHRRTPVGPRHCKNCRRRDGEQPSTANGKARRRSDKRRARYRDRWVSCAAWHRLRERRADSIGTTETQDDQFELLTFCFCRESKTKVGVVLATHPLRNHT